MTWQDHAACKGMNPDLFYPDGKGDARHLYREARAICFTCPVRLACLDHAITANELTYGMFGGLTPGQRRRHATQTTSPVAGPRVQREHGTTAGYQQHRRDDTPPCPPCVTARSTYERTRRLQGLAR